MTTEAMLIDDLMQSEATGLEEILGDPNDTLGEAYDVLQNSDMDVEEALGFASLLGDEEKEIMDTLNELYKSGMSLAQIKRAMKDWIKQFFTAMSDAISEYKDFINLTYNTIQKSNQNKSTIKERLGTLDEIEKCMDFHLEWGFTMSIFKKFEKENKAVTKIQSRFKGNKDRQMLEKSGLWYQDATSHWKKKNKKKVMASLLKEMITEDMTNERKAEVREEIRTFLVDKGFASSKKTKKKKKPTKKKPNKQSKKKN